MAEDWVWTDHIKLRIVERNISKDLVLEALNFPDEIVKKDQNRAIYQKKMDGRLVRVVVEKNRLITVYITSKVGKYMRSEEV